MALQSIRRALIIFGLVLPVGAQAEPVCGTVEQLQISPIFSLEQRTFVEAALCRAPITREHFLIVSGMAFDGAQVKQLWSRRYPIAGQVTAMGFEVDGPVSTLLNADLAAGQGLQLRVDLAAMEVAEEKPGTLAGLEYQ